MTGNKIHKFKLSLLKETFMSEAKDNSLLLETKSFILESYTNRIELQMNQKEYSAFKGLKLQTVKRIELGQCYDLRLISKYLK
jgi:hypothetical protein